MYITGGSTFFFLGGKPEDIKFLVGALFSGEPRSVSKSVQVGVEAFGVRSRCGLGFVVIFIYTPGSTNSSLAGKWTRIEDVWTLLNMNSCQLC